MDTKQEVVIDLESLEKTEIFDEKNLIHQRHFCALRDMIFSRVEANLKAKKGTLLYQPCFFINGSRGSGKTTHLRALQRSLCRRTEQGVEGKIRIEHLACIDPTELSEKENFFVYIISFIQKLMDKHRNNYMDDNRYEHVCALKKGINKLIKGLAGLMYHPGSMENMGEAQFYVQESLEGGVSSADLKEQFALMVEKMCELVQADALLVTVDDADMNFNKCRDVFETVRKYLLDKRMVFVFAGDLRLYSQVVRGMQMQHFGEMALRYDTQRARQRQQLLDDLEEQYIMKLFPISNRMRLRDFGVVMNHEDVKITYRDALKERQENKLKEYLNVTLPARVPCYVPNLMSRYLSILHTRSALQLLAYWTGNSHKDMSEKEACLCWSRGVSRVTSHALMKHQIDANDIYEGGIYTLVATIRRFVPKIKLGIEGAMLLHSIGSELDQLVSFFLSTEVSRQVKSYQDQLTYMLILFCMLKKDDVKNFSLQNNVVCGVPGAYERQIAANFTALMLPLCQERGILQKRFAHGVVPLFTFGVSGGGKELRRNSVFDAMRKIGEIVKQSDDKDTLLYYLALLHSLSLVVENNRSYYCLSVYNMLAVTIRLLRTANANPRSRRKHIRNTLLGIEDIKVTVRNVDVSDISAENELSEDLLQNIKEVLDFVLKNRNDLIELIVEEMEQWVNACQEQELLVTATSMANCWQAFIQQGMLVTKAAKITSTRTQELAVAGKLFANYMSAWSRVIVSCNERIKPEDAENQLQYCPLWCIVQKAANNEKNESILEKAIRETNGINIGQIEIVFDERNIKSFYDSKLRNRKTRLESALQEESRELLRGQTTQLSGWCAAEMEQIQNMYTEAAYEQLNKMDDKYKLPYQDLPEREAGIIASYVETSMKNLKIYNEKSQNKLWLNFNEKVMKEIVHELQEELNLRGAQLWSRIQRDLRMSEGGDEAMQFIDNKLLDFFHSQRKLVWEYKETVEHSLNIQIIQWKRVYMKHVNATIRNLVSTIRKNHK